MADEVRFSVALASDNFINLQYRFVEGLSDSLPLIRNCELHFKNQGTVLRQATLIVNAKKPM